MGTFFHHPDGFVTINGERFSLEVFKIVDPYYSLPPGVISQCYRQGEGHWIGTGDSTFDGEYPWTDGDIYIGRLSDFLAVREEDERETREVKKAVDKARFDALPAAEKRQLQYPTQGEMLEALWKTVVLGQSLKDSGCVDLQRLRDEVDSRYPTSDINK